METAFVMQMEKKSSVIGGIKICKIIKSYKTAFFMKNIKVNYNIAHIGNRQGKNEMLE